MCSDIEKNPGQYNFAGIVQTSFSQSHGKFIVTQGIQCTCISLYSVCFSSFKLIFDVFIRRPTICYCKRGSVI